MSDWIAVDLDGTLAYFDKWRGLDHIGEPIPMMLHRVKQWIEQGQTVKIFTARMEAHGLPIVSANEDEHGLYDVVTPIENWCRLHVGRVLEVTNRKGMGMKELWDDRAIQVIMNTGQRVG